MDFQDPEYDEIDVECEEFHESEESDDDYIEIVSKSESEPDEAGGVDDNIMVETEEPIDYQGWTSSKPEPGYPYPPFETELGNQIELEFHEESLYFLSLFSVGMLNK